MARSFLKVVLVLGVVFGLASGFGRLWYHGHGYGYGYGHGFRHDRHAEFERHIAQVCVDAALDVQKRPAGP